MTPIIWDNCRRANGTINLESAAKQTGCYFTEAAIRYLDAVENIRPVTSRQIAAVAIASALDISAREELPQKEGSQ